MKHIQIPGMPTYKIDVEPVEEGTLLERAEASLSENVELSLDDQLDLLGYVQNVLGSLRQALEDSRYAVRHESEGEAYDILCWAVNDILKEGKNDD